MLLIIAVLILANCTAERSAEGSTDTLWIDQQPVEYNNTVKLVFILKGEYRLYDIESGQLVYTRYKDESIWLNEGYDTVNITLPDSVVTYRYEYNADKLTVIENTFTDNSVYQYHASNGWVYQESSID